MMMMTKMMFVNCFVVLRPLPGVPTISITDMLAVSKSYTQIYGIDVVTNIIPKRRTTNLGHFIILIMAGDKNFQRKPISKDETSLDLNTSRLRLVICILTNYFLQNNSITLK